MTTQTCPCCGQQIRAARKSRAPGVAPATTAAEFLEPVGRRKFGKDRIAVPVECTFADGEVKRLTIGRHPKDSDALALEAGRRLAVLLRAGAAYLGPHRTAAAAVSSAARDAAIAGQRDAWLASWTRRDQEFDPARHADHTLAAIAANTAARKYAAANPPPPLVWHGRRLSYPAAVIEQAARELVECRIAPADSLYADAAE